MMNSKILIDYYAITASAYDETRFPWQSGPLGIIEKEEISRVLKGRFLLDCGVGSGRYSSAFGKNHFFVGCDLSKEMIVFCKGKLRAKNINAHLILADAQRLPLANDVFDSVICSRTFKFFSEPNEFLGEVKRCLRKGGKCIISVGLRDSFLFKLALRLRLTKLNNKKYGTQERYYFQEEGLNLFCQTGFNSVTIVPVGNLFFGFYSFLWFHLYSTPFSRIFKHLPMRLVKSILKIGREHFSSFALIMGEK
jgi:ubiquinone/menaquinone biosynthesis C-methylase UbiE